MTENKGNWPDPSNPGVPLNAERDGWHWLQDADGELRCAEWVEYHGRHCAWDGWNRGVRNLIYIGQALLPTEVADLVEQARREERETCANICAEGAIKIISNGRARVSKIDQQIAVVLRRHEALIRARTTP
jgi:hypothetical protein